MIPIPTSMLTGAAATLGGALVMLGWRMRETQRPVTVPLIVIPPLGMSTGFCMFLYPPSRIPLSWALGAFALGALVLAEPLRRSSRLEWRGTDIVLRRSRAFLWILVGLVAARFALRGYIGHLVSPMQTAGVLFVLAFGMISRWRVSMYMEYQRLVRAGPAIAT
ncbi:MAG: cytochrome c biogenesis protein CcdC [Gemmatimonadaceae bacterium]|nr:cytochrome c biogenesis protein CcdC [Gemmatimonadaceae bacterium]